MLVIRLVCQRGLPWSGERKALLLLFIGSLAVCGVVFMLSFWGVTF